MSQEQSGGPHAQHAGRRRPGQAGRRGADGMHGWMKRRERWRLADGGWRWVRWARWAEGRGGLARISPAGLMGRPSTPDLLPRPLSGERARGRAREPAAQFFYLLI